MRVKVKSNSPTKKDLELYLKSGLEKLAWYKSKGRSAQSIIDAKIMTATFVNKYYETI